MNHIAILKKSKGLLPKILSKEKIIESRWYKNRYTPWNRIKKEDVIYFKNSGEPVTVKVEVSKVIQYSDLDLKIVKQILNQYGVKIGFNPNNFDEYSQTLKDKNYCILIFLKNLKEISPFNIDKTGFGLMSAWITIDNVNRIKVK